MGAEQAKYSFLELDLGFRLGDCGVSFPSSGRGIGWGWIWHMHWIGLDFHYHVLLLGQISLGFVPELQKSI
jgi:hypothetical protein